MLSDVGATAADQRADTYVTSGTIYVFAYSSVHGKDHNKCSRGADRKQTLFTVKSVCAPPRPPSRIHFLRSDTL